MSIYTPILKPIFNSLEEREGFINSLENKFSNIGEWVDYITKNHATLLEKARWYVFQNWEKVKDWSDYVITIDGIDYTNRRLCQVDEENDNSALYRITKQIDSKRVNIDKITIVYDFHDSDISISINHEEKWKFLNEDEVLELAIYIEENI